MPKLSCKCGSIINLSVIPCPDGYLLTSEKLWDQIADDSTSAEGLAEALMQRSTEAYLCPRCGRLLVFWDPEQKEIPTFYLPERP